MLFALLAPPPQRETRPLEAIESISTGNGTPVAVRDVNHDANVIAELDATWMSFPRGAILPSARPPGRGKRALPLTRPLGRFCDFGGRSRSNIMKSLLKVEAAGIERTADALSCLLASRSEAAIPSVAAREQAAQAASFRRAL
jgi:hypothetical protein